MMKGTIFNIQKFCTHDGPGIRTTVFFKGCNMRCKWCHNPESQNPQNEIMFYKNKCNGCGRCQQWTGEAEAFVCYQEAREVCGQVYSVDALLEEVLQDKAYYENSGGGVTFSGGECMLQIDFLLEMLKKCKENGIHTAVDTAGHISWESFKKIMPYTDMFLYDIKLMDSEAHREWTGVTNERILGNLAELLASGACVWVRIPVVPGVNDTEAETEKIKAFFEKNGHPQNIECIPYHQLGEHKYEALGRKADTFSIPEAGRVEAQKAALSQNK